MWESFEARLDENERERPLPLRGALFGLVPVVHIAGTPET